MKNKKTNEFKQFKEKIFIRTVIMLIGAVVFVIYLYSFILQGKFANWTVAVFQKIFWMDYDEALAFYHQTIRGHTYQIFMFAMVVVFCVVFRIYLNWFTKYFYEINRSIDTLMNDEVGEVVLPPELVSVEKKINFIKHTITKQKMEMQLAEQRKNDLVMYLAHDLKTPLSSVIGYLTLLKEEQEISAVLRERYLTITLDKAQRLEDLINEFFEITRFNLSHITLEFGNINLTRMLEQLVYEFQPTLTEKNLKCELKAPADMMLQCDADKLQRVFDNLLRNAVYYSYEDTVIKVNTEQFKDSILVRFINEGNTIPAEKLERVFEQFFRLDSARSSDSGGAGLGLAIAKEIVRLHHGTITAHSENGVTCFEVMLPLL